MLCTANIEMGKVFAETWRRSSSAASAPAGGGVPITVCLLEDANSVQRSLDANKGITGGLLLLEAGVTWNWFEESLCGDLYLGAATALAKLLPTAWHVVVCPSPASPGAGPQWRDPEQVGKWLASPDVSQFQLGHIIYWYPHSVNNNNQGGERARCPGGFCVCSRRVKLGLAVVLVLAVVAAVILVAVLTAPKPGSPTQPHSLITIQQLLTAHGFNSPAGAVFRLLREAETVG